MNVDEAMRNYLIIRREYPNLSEAAVTGTRLRPMYAKENTRPCAVLCAAMPAQANVPNRDMIGTVTLTLPPIACRAAWTKPTPLPTGSRELAI